MKTSLLKPLLNQQFKKVDGVVEFRHARGGFVFLTDSHGEECLYEDLDAASKSAMAVGFQQVRIEDR